MNYLNDTQTNECAMSPDGSPFYKSMTAGVE